MKIKRFFAPDIRNAMKMVKEELGPDAVIMSNRSVDGGVEIVAARDFDEQVIQNKLQKQPTENAAAVQKNAELPHFDEGGKSLHIISSPRKKGADGSIPENPLRRKREQYLGYAEKVHLATTSQGNRFSNNKAQSHARQQAVATTEAKEAERSGRFSSSRNASASSAALERIVEQMRNEIHQEMSGLKSLLDTRLAALARREDPDTLANIPLQRELTELGFSAQLAEKIIKELGDQADAPSAFEKAQDRLSSLIPLADDSLLDEGGVVALVGPTGVGKTTTIAKIAARFILRHGSGEVALISTDNYRIGAFEQLGTYGRILDVPVRVANNADELRKHIDSFSDKRMILIDTAGMGQRDLRLAEQIDILQQADLPIRSYLVMSAATQYQAMHQIIDGFQHYQPHAAILTKLDEAVALGAPLSVVIEQHLSLAFVTDGQQVPEDIHLPEPVALIERCITEMGWENDYTNDLSHEQWVSGYA